ncbi:MAG: transglycosylase domain-containing protein [Xanthobacteraceae bacterium]
MNLLRQGIDLYRRSRAFRAALSFAVAIVAAPYVLVVLYGVVNPVSTLMIWHWLTGQRVEQTYVPLERMAPILPLTVIVAEDARFCSHRGVDFQELREIVQDAEDFDNLRGGSTITQQMVKNLFLWHGRSYTRKLLEFPLALWADLVLPKRRVMEIYLNVVEWGPGGTFGAEAAARHAFGKSARQVSGGEAALLAAVLPDPARRSARRANVRRLAGIYTARAARSSWLAECLKPRRTP